MSAVATFIKDIKGDKIIWMIGFILCIASIMAVYSATSSMAYQTLDASNERFLIQQILFILGGAVVTYLCYRFHYMRYAQFAKIIFGITILLLLYTMVFGDEINQARRWIGIPWINKTIQTSDVAKIGLIIFLSNALAKRQDNIKSFKQAFVPLIVPVVLVCLMIVSSDLSTAAILFVTCLMLMFIGRVDMKYILLLVGIGIFAFLFVFMLGTIFPEHIRTATWISRFNEFFTEGGYQVMQSKIAIANGEWLGVGPGNSVQKNYLPYAYADFIYAVICEEYGLVGGIGILLLYLWLLLRCTIMVTKCPKTFGAILAYGLCLNLVLQAFANIAVSVHLVPATGLTLPLVSMGGTSLIFTCISLGIILSVSKYVQEARLKQLELQEIEKLDESNN